MNHTAVSSDNKQLDWPSFAIFLSLMLIGWLMIYAASYDIKNPTSIFDINTAYGKQIMWIGLSIMLFFIIQIIEWKFWRTFSYLIYGISLILLILVLFFGVTIKGATAWFSFMGFSFQPAEIAKFGTSLALSNYMSAKSFKLGEKRHAINITMLILLPVGLIMLQPDAGSALVFLSFLILLFRQGLSVIYYVIGAFLVAVFIGALLFNTYLVVIALFLLSILALVFTKSNKLYWLIGFSMLLIANVIAAIESFYIYALIADILIFLLFAAMVWQRGEVRMVLIIVPALVIGTSLAYFANYTFENILAPHQQDRINVWLHPEKCDPRGSLYNLLQSKMAISSGGLEGKGFMEGTLTKLNYVPEQSTDFIFCTIGEEHGFIGVIVLISLFVGLFIRLVKLAERQRLLFVRNYIYCILGILFFHFFINIGMTMGLVPVIGIPLPFVSYGGSSLLGFTLMISVLLKLDKTRHGGV